MSVREKLVRVLQYINWHSTSTSRCHKPQPTSASWINFSAVSVVDTTSTWWKEKTCTSQWGWNNFGELHVEICWKRWGTCADGEVGQISAWYYYHAVIALRVKWQGLSQGDTVSFPCGKGKVPALKLHQYSCTSWGTGGTRCHTKWLDGYMSDIFIISLLRESTAPVQHLSQKNLLHWIRCPSPIRI